MTIVLLFILGPIALVFFAATIRGAGWTDPLAEKADYALMGFVSGLFWTIVCAVVFVYMLLKVPGRFIKAIWKAGTRVGTWMRRTT